MPPAESCSLSRRSLIRASLTAGAGLALGGCTRFASHTRAEAAGEDGYHPCYYYERLESRKVRCGVCPRQCVVGDRERGFCGSRENRGGDYFTLVYGYPAALNVDPIEKKPFFHYYPGSRAFSLGTAGCNMDCKDCQNWDVSQSRPEQVRAAYLPPAEVVAGAKRHGATVIAYTYTEPVTFYEYMYDTACAGRRAGLYNVVVSNGYIRPEPLKQLCKAVDAVKVDLKGFTEDFYRKYCVATLQPVLDALQILAKERPWLEIVYLVVPGLNDQDYVIRGAAKWLRAGVGPNVPLHFTRFYPQYQLKNLPPTPYETLVKARRIAIAEGLHYVYVGNVPGSEYEHTYCHGCGKAVVRRQGFEVLSLDIRGGKCRYCGVTVPGVWGV